VIIGIGAALWCNYFYGMVFGSTAIVVTTPLLFLAYVFSLNFRPDFTTQSMAESFQPQLWYAIISMSVAILVLTAVALAASTRLSQVMTLATTLGVFLVGMLSDWVIGRRLDSIRRDWLSRARDEGLTEWVERTRLIQLTTGEVSEPMIDQVEVATVGLLRFAEGTELIWYWILSVAYAIIPNFQTMILIDALTQYHVIPFSYVANSVLYGLFLMLAFLALAVILFQRREVG
jgi:ABC-2 type transport system permease protein